MPQFSWKVVVAGRAGVSSPATKSSTVKARPCSRFFEGQHESFVLDMSTIRVAKLHWLRLWYGISVIGQVRIGFTTSRYPAYQFPPQRTYEPDRGSVVRFYPAEDIVKGAVRCALHGVFKKLIANLLVVPSRGNVRGRQC